MATTDARAKRRALDRILESHAGWERRTLADLRAAGFRFQTIGEARRYQLAQRALEQMTEEQMIELVMSSRERKQA